MTTTTTTTATIPPMSISLYGADGPAMTLPTTLPAHLVAGVPKLSREQAGHLRHFYNMAAQLDGEWRGMGSQEPAQEWLDAYRYQLATAAYAAGAAHFHRLPALRSIFRDLLGKLIHKMLRREVWGYWYLTSQSGKFVNPEITELRKPWADPNKQENIMYSGHLLLMVSLYSMLFDDDSFDEPGGLTFDWDPIFWGMGPERFRYSRSSLQQTIIDEMERGKWLGVCCEPNNIFIVCNQFPIIAIRYNDVRNGTAVVEDVIAKYKAAWQAKGMMNSEGRFLDTYLVQQDMRIFGRSIAFTAWGSAFMNGWNSEQVHATYPYAAHGFITQLTSPPAAPLATLNSPMLAAAIRELVPASSSTPATELARAHDPAVLADAHARVAAAPEPPPPTAMFMSLGQPTLGYVLQWVSEVGDAATLSGLLATMEARNRPTWEAGGLFYPRESSTAGATDEPMDPYTGNAGVGYARLNVPDGQRIMWERAWTPAELARRPYVDGVDLGAGVDFVRGQWCEAEGALVLTGRTWNGAEKTVHLIVRNLTRGRYGVYVAGALVEERHVDSDGGEVKVEVCFDAVEKDVVVLKG